MPAFFIAAQNSRHRRACFALYRALLRQATAVPLPDDILTARGPINPIKHLIRKSFRRNRRDTSPRLVVSALKHGYRFLGFFRKAQSSTSIAHASIVSFLRARISDHSLARGTHDAHAALAPSLPPEKSRQGSAPKPGTLPLLTKVSPPPESTPQPYSHCQNTPLPPPPVYVSNLRPRPLSALKEGAIRKIPTLDETYGFPFLRLTKPQPPELSRVLRQKSVKRQKVVSKVVELVEETLPGATAEDRWEQSVEHLMRRQQQQHERRCSDDHDSRSGELRNAWLNQAERGESGYAVAVRADIKAKSRALSMEHADCVARGRVLWEIIEQEMALAAKEKEERRELRRKTRAENSNLDKSEAGDGKEPTTAA